jgi:hypothetical protein
MREGETKFSTSTDFNQNYIILIRQFLDALASLEPELVLS